MNRGDNEKGIIKVFNVSSYDSLELEIKKQERILTKNAGKMPAKTQKE